MHKPEAHPIDWAAIIQGDLKRFKLALDAGWTVEEARRISTNPPPMHYDRQSQGVDKLKTFVDRC